MKRVFLVATLLISASVYADEKDFPSFLSDYQVFLDKRNIDNQGHTAKFRGNLVFKDGCSPASFYGRKIGGNSDEVCECPPGNNYLQCLISAQATITTDPKDVGGKGYVLVMSGTSFLDRSGQWKPMPQPNAYTTTIGSMGTTNTFSIPVPDAATIARLCSSQAEPFKLIVGYGAAMPMEMEFARRMKVRSVQMGQAFDEEAYIFSRARLNGTRPRKIGEIGSVTCRPEPG